MSRVSFYTRPYDRLEPYDGKLSRTVLRGGAGSNASLLPDIKTEADILKFVNALISNTKGEGKEGDPFWTKAETLLYCALIAYIIFEGPAEDRNMNTLVDMISGMEVKEDDENYKNAVDYMFDGLAKRKPDCFAVKQYRKFKLSSGKTAKSILISCGARLAPFDIPQLREIMSYDELELDRMGDRRTATFFCISDTDSTYNFLVALAFSQMFNLLCERADNVHGGRLPHHVRVLWDEAANTGQVPQLEKLVAVIRSREISLCLLYQQLAQCKAIYDKNAETILGNMDSVLFLGGREWKTGRISRPRAGLLLVTVARSSIPTANRPSSTSPRPRSLRPW